MAVAAGPAGLLVVGLQGSRQVEVDDLADVGDVDSHAERHGGHHHPQPAGGEVVLHPAPRLVAQPRVVGRSGQAPASDPVGNLLGGGDGGAVDERPAGAGIEGSAQGFELVRVGPAALCGQGQVGPVETGDGHQRVTQGQRAHDVGPHLGCGGGREGGHGRIAAGFQGPPDQPVVGPEVMAPRGDAVGLVDHHPAHGQPAQHVDETRP